MTRPHLFLGHSCHRCGASLRSLLAPSHLRDECHGDVVAPDDATAWAKTEPRRTAAEVRALHEQAEAAVCDELHALRSDIAACRLLRSETEARLALLADLLWQVRKASKAAQL